MTTQKDSLIEDLDDIFRLYPQIKLVYFFGSKARGTDGPLSDYDFAIYLDEKDFKKRFEIRLELLAKVSRELKTDDVDLCVLNDVQSPEFKYSIIQEGRLIYKKEPFKVLVEPRILNDYFDFMYTLRKYHLTKA